MKESDKINVSQRLAVQTRMIIKKGWFLELEILEVCEQLNSAKNVRKEPL